MMYIVPIWAVDKLNVIPQLCNSFIYMTCMSECFLILAGMVNKFIHILYQASLAVCTVSEARSLDDFHQPGITLFTVLALDGCSFK